MEKEKRKKNGRRKKENSTELQKHNIEAEVFNNNRKCDLIYTYTYTPINKIKVVQKNKVQQMDLASKGKQKLYLPNQK